MGGFIGVGPSASSHGGIFFLTGPRNTTVDGSSPLLAGDMHACPRKHHGVTTLSGSGFATAMGRRFSLSGLDRSGCGAYITMYSPTTTSD